MYLNRIKVFYDMKPCILVITNLHGFMSRCKVMKSYEDTQVYIIDFCSSVPYVALAFPRKVAWKEFIFRQHISVSYTE